MELTDGVKNSRRTREHVLGGRAPVRDNIDRAQVRRIDGMGSEQLSCRRTLQRRKTKPPPAVAPQKEDDESIAETADAVIADDR